MGELGIGQAVFTGVGGYRCFVHWPVRDSLGGELCSSGPADVRGERSNS